MRLARARSPPTIWCHSMLHCRAWVTGPSRAYRSDSSSSAADRAHGRRSHRCRTVHGATQCRGRAPPTCAPPFRSGAARPQHRAHFARIDLSPDTAEGYPIAVAAAGSAALRTPNNPLGNRFNLITIHDNGRIDVESLHMGPAPRRTVTVVRATTSRDSPKRSRARSAVPSSAPASGTRSCAARGSCSSRSARSAKFCPLVKRETSRARRGFPMLPLLGGVDAE